MSVIDSNSPPSILIADDHALFCDALATYIARAMPDARVTVCEDLNQVRDKLAGSNFNMAMIDWHMPGVGGIDDLINLSKKYPDVRFALLSGVIEIEEANRILAGGFFGYFPKTLSGRALIDGIKTILGGKEFIPLIPGNRGLQPSYRGEALFYHPTGVAPVSPESVGLTPREMDILRYLVRGMTNSEIAEKTGIKDVTVKLHLRNACQKLGARNRTDAALKCRQSGLFDNE